LKRHAACCEYSNRMSSLARKLRPVLWTGIVCFTAATAGAADTAAPARSQNLPAGTHLRVRLGQSLDTRRDGPGTPFVAHVATPVVRNGEMLIPRGAVCRGHVVEARPSGRLKGRAVLRLNLESIEINGRRHEIETTAPAFFSKSHKERNLAMIGGGAGTGAAIGGIAGGGVGALAGAGAGAVAGTAGAVITGKRNVHVAAESRLTFALRRPLAIAR